MLKKARGEIWPKRSERRNNTKNYPDEDKKFAINKKVNSQIKKPHLKMIPIKDNLWSLHEKCCLLNLKFNLIGNSCILF